MIKLIDGEKVTELVMIKIIERIEVDPRVMLQCYGTVLDIEAENKAEHLRIAFGPENGLVAMGGPKLGPYGMGWMFAGYDRMKSHKLYQIRWNEWLSSYFKHAVTFISAVIVESVGVYSEQKYGFELDNGDVVLFEYDKELDNEESHEES